MEPIEKFVPGGQLAPFVVKPNSRQLVLWAAASGDFNPLHYDLEYARSRGQAGVVVHGGLKAGFMSRALAAWAGEDCFVRQLSVSYRRVDLVNQPFTVQGEVVETAREPGLLVATIRLSGVSADGTISTEGAATIDLPLSVDGG